MNTFKGNIENLTLTNKFFRKVISTTKEQQLVLMSIPVGVELGMEVHSDTTQFIRIEYGTAIAICKTSSQKMYKLKDGDCIVIPAGTHHNIINSNPKESLQLYTIYSPPHHPANTKQKTKPIE
jgi:mannose-6-phosphate isomerase-like protein (cupin superfamily)